MVQQCQNHWKTIEVNGGLKKNINHSIALKNWPSSWSIQEGFETPVAQSGENVVEFEKVLKETAKEVEVESEVELESEVEVESEKTAKEVEVSKVDEQDSDWETIIEDCEKGSEIDSETGIENDFPAIDVDCENWAEKYTTSIHRFHNSGNISSQTDIKETKCPNCGGAFNPLHQCWASSETSVSR